MKIIIKPACLHTLTKILFLSLCLILTSSLLLKNLAYAQTYTQTTLISANWGDGPQEFGLIAGKGRRTQGPRFFTLDKNGNIYILDNVNGHIKKYNQNGVYQSKISNFSICWAFAIGDNGNIFILSSNAITEYSQSGEIVNTYQVADDIKLVAGVGLFIKFDNLGNIYVNEENDNSYKIVRRVGSVMERTPSEEQLTSVKRGLISSNNNNVIRSNWEDKKHGKISVLTSDGPLIKVISVESVDTLGAIKFIRQDINNYYYVETERITNDDYVHLEVRRYDAEGNLVSTVEAQNDYYCEVDKSIDVDELGNIYQLFPSEEGVKIFKWVLN